jgi:hypothetical protein
MRGWILWALLALPSSAAPLSISAVTWNAATPGDVAIETVPAMGPITVTIFDGGRLVLRGATAEQALALARGEGLLP